MAGMNKSEEVADPDLQIGGRVGRRGGGGSHPNPEIKGGDLQKLFFGPSGAQFGLKISGGGPPGTFPGSATE